MMGDMSREPSMEEILSSIRRVIARDDPVQAGDNSVATTTASTDRATLRAVPPAPLSDDDVLDLTQTTEADGDGTAPEPAPLNTSSPETLASAATVEPASPLVAAESVAASRHSLETLAAMLETVSESQPSAPQSGPLTVNALVESAVRPMLKDWLDANLPAIVERLVAREIARITGARL
jgi:uncharacterized protein